MEALKDKLIESIHVNRANFECIAAKGYINGTLYVEIKRVMDEYLSEGIKAIIQNAGSVPRCQNPPKPPRMREAFGPRNEDC